MSGDSTSWEGWSHVRWFVEEVGFPPKPWRVPLCCLRLDGSDLLVLDRRQQPGGAMATAGVVEVVAPGRHNLSCLGLGGEPMPGQHLVFEGGEERLRGGVVEARPDASHRLPDPELAAQFREIACGVGGSAISVEDDLVDHRAAAAILIASPASSASG